MDTTGFITNGKFQAVLDGLENFVIQKISNNILIKDLVFKRDNQRNSIIYNKFKKTLKLEDFLNSLEN